MGPVVSSRLRGVLAESEGEHRRLLFASAEQPLEFAGGVVDDGEPVSYTVAPTLVCQPPSRA